MPAKGYRIDDLLEREIRCECGRVHRIRTRRVDIGPGAATRLPEHIRALPFAGRILLIADANTWKAAGREAADALMRAGLETVCHVLPGENIHADERAVGSVMLAAEPQPGLLVAVGSGSINDLGRFCATRMGIPYLVLATAASVDGYASDVTPVMRGGVKITYPGIHPEIIAADPAVLAAAPPAMLAAGLGDMIGKHTARLDWLLAQTMTGESYCPFITGIVENALSNCVALSVDMKPGDVAAARAVFEALVLSGLGMQMQGNSRPASGSEHHIAHFLEMRDALRGRPPSLHGDKVGAASLLVMRLYERFFQGGPPECTQYFARTQEAGIRRAFGPITGDILRGLPAPVSRSQWAAQWRGLTARWDFFRAEAAQLPALRARYSAALRAAGGAASLNELGYCADDIRDALLFAWAVRPRFTILSLLEGLGILARLTGEVLDEQN